MQRFSSFSFRSNSTVYLLGAGLPWVLHPIEAEWHRDLNASLGFLKFMFMKSLPNVVCVLVDLFSYLIFFVSYI